MQRAGQRERSGVPGVIAECAGGMRIGAWQRQNFAHNLAKADGPPPVAVKPMLGLTRTPGQADADHGTYDFSLEHPR